MQAKSTARLFATLAFTVILAVEAAAAVPPSEAPDWLVEPEPATAFGAAAVGNR
jgi:hypothetical protein